MVTGLESEKGSLFSFSRSARSWRSGPRLPRKLWGVRGGLIENIFTIIGGRDDGDNYRNEVGGCCVVRRVCVSLLLEASCLLHCFIDSKLFWWSWFALVRNLLHVECWICPYLFMSWSISTAAKHVYSVKYLRTRPFYWTLTSFFSSSSTRSWHNYLFIIFIVVFIIDVTNNITKQTPQWCFFYCCYRKYCYHHPCIILSNSELRIHRAASHHIVWLISDNGHHESLLRS